VKRVEKNEKWATRPRGGGVKKTLVKNKIENDWWDGKKS
jgi:hypothetical protein